jgi:prefoldin subunit 5
MKKDIVVKPPLAQAIETLQGAIDTLDDMIADMQKNQALLSSWLEPQEIVGWVETNEN